MVVGGWAVAEGTPNCILLHKKKQYVEAINLIH